MPQASRPWKPRRVRFHLLQRVTSLYPRHLVNQAGRALALATDFEQGLSEDLLEVIGNWRAAHSFPLNTLKLWLVKKSLQVDQHGLVAQRLKRLSSIALKLRRFPDMKLTQMQDVGGCRAIVADVKGVNALRAMYAESEIRHELVHEDDYIDCPKESGYRGIHLIYRYKSDKTTAFNGLKIEVQLRSRLQHAWATAVETVGTFSQQALKSSQGQEDWLRFFSLMGSAIALRERCALVPGTPVINRELYGELRDYARRLDVVKRLRLYATSLNISERSGTEKNAQYFLLELDPAAMRIKITGYRSSELEKASRDYLKVEKRVLSRVGGPDAVLVSGESLSALKRTYPNYFLDTSRFTELVTSATEGRRKKNLWPGQMTLPFRGELLRPT